MIHASNFHANADALSDADRAELKARASRLLAEIYRSVGLAAIANELALPPDDFEPELRKAVKRGARYLYLAAAPQGASQGQ
jgi:hypothetical protein